MKLELQFRVFGRLESGSTLPEMEVCILSGQYAALWPVPSASFNDHRYIIIIMHFLARCWMFYQ